MKKTHEIPKKSEKFKKSQKSLSGFMFSIFSVVFIDMLGLGIAIPVLAPLLIKENGILPAEYDFAIKSMIYGLVIATFPLAQFFGAPILGALSDKYGRKRMLAISIFSTLLSYVVFATGIMLNSLLLIFIGRIVSGFMGGNVSIALSAIADISDEKTKAKNFGVVGMAFGFGFLIGPFLGGKLSDPAVISWFTYATPFWFAAILSAINLVLLFRIFPETLKTRVHTEISMFTGFRNIKKAFLMTNLRTMFIVIFLFAFGFSFYTQFVQVYLIEKFSFAQSDIGNFFAFLGFWVAFTQGVLMRWITKIFSPEQALKFSFLLTAAAFFAILIPQKSYLLFFIVPFIAIGQGITHPNSSAVLSNLSSRESQGEILGINQSIMSLAQTFPPLISGVIASIAITLPIIVAGVCTFAAWLVFIVFFNRKKKEVFKEV